MGINRVVIVGHLGSKPELKTSLNGRAYANLSIATTRPINGPEEKEFRTVTDWHSVTVWGKRGESCAEYLVKGQLVAVEGYLSTFLGNAVEAAAEKQTTNDGRIGITAKSVQFLARPQAK